MTNLRVVDGDGHIMEEPNDIWTSERIDHDRWGDWVPHKVVEDEIYETTYVGGVGARRRTRAPRPDGRRGRHDAPASSTTCSKGCAGPGGHEPAARLADMDADGIDAVVLYPSLAMFFGPCDEIAALHDAEFVADCQRAYNDWLADFCAYDPAPLVRRRGRAAPGRRARVRGSRARGRDRAARRVRAAVGVRRRAAAQPSRLRRLLVDV